MKIFMEAIHAMYNWFLHFLVNFLAIFLPLGVNCAIPLRYVQSPSKLVCESFKACETLLWIFWVLQTLYKKNCGIGHKLTEWAQTFYVRCIGPVWPSFVAKTKFGCLRWLLGWIGRFTLNSSICALEKFVHSLWPVCSLHVIIFNFGTLFLD